MTSDFEIVQVYIIKNDKQFYDKLSYEEKVLYACQVRNTTSFILYLLRYRILEFCNEFVKFMKG